MKLSGFYTLALHSLVSFYCIYVTSSQNGDGSNRRASEKSVEKSLIREILGNYNNSGRVGRPVANSSDVITVRLGLALIQILDLDENKQVLRTICWMRYYWLDGLLEWTSDKWKNNKQGMDYSLITQIRVFPDQVWTPDIKLYNFADERLKERREARVVVYNDGSVLWVPQALFLSTCPVEITYFPYDSQICYMDFGSWTYDTTQLKLTWWQTDDYRHEIPYIDFTNYVKSNEWETDGEFEKKYRRKYKLPFYQRHKQIRSLKRFRDDNFTTESGEKQTRRYAVLRYRLRITRNPKFYVSILVLPCILLSCLTLVLFWLPPESPAKMMLGMNIFVAFFVLLLLLAESTPSAVKNFPLIGSYYCLNMIMITLSTFLAVIVINLYFRGDRKGPVPPTIRRIFIEGMGRLLLVRQNIPLPDEKKLAHAIVGEAFCRPGGAPHHRTRKVHLPELKYNKFQMDDMSNQDSFANANGLNPGSAAEAGCSGLVEPEDSPIMSNYNSGVEKDVREIKRYVRMFVSRQKDKERKNLLAMEWRTMALVLDRMFFVLYVVAICTAFITMLPRTQPRKADPMAAEAARQMAQSKEIDLMADARAAAVKAADAVKQAAANMLPNRFF